VDVAPVEGYRFASADTSPDHELDYGAMLLITFCFVDNSLNGFNRWLFNLVLLYSRWRCESAWVSANQATTLSIVQRFSEYCEDVASGISRSTFIKDYAHEAVNV